MSSRSFRSVFMVGAIASAALGCYLVSLRVASERAALESVENRIVLAQRDIRLLETEIGTRGRLAQLERWNVKVIRLSAPSADQFVEGAFQLATLAKPDRRPVLEAPLVLAAAPVSVTRAPAVTSDGADAPRTSRPISEMMHVANYTKPEPRRAPIPVATVRPATKAAALVPAKKSPAAPKPVKTASTDPLGPLSTTSAKSDSASRATKDSGSN
ncbi:MAG TPA: hypothetical protein VNI79_09115 [Sphingomicrobium sp.]|nr:hypothetical protein [Sphingomicrobium sp.]